MTQKSEALETLGLRLHKDAIRKLKKVALDLDTTASEITKKALTLWWKQNKEAQQYGVLFPEESSPSTAASEVASEQSTPKKAAPVEAVGSVTKDPPRQAPSKGPKKK